jgi:hypothetical protein
MPKTIYRFNFVPTYTHAYNQFNQFLSLDAAVKLNEQQTYNWYLDSNLEVELILSAISSEKVCPHFKTKPNQKITTKDGVKHNYTQESYGESYEHTFFKNKIIEEKKFIFNNYKVNLKEAIPEFYILNNKFRIDVKGKLMCETDCIIEVIKTSDISNIKELEINRNQILTFKLYIDNDGNQQHNKSDIIGNSEIENIRSRIQKGRGAIEQLRESIDFNKKRIHQQGTKLFKEDNQRVQRLKGWITKRIINLQQQRVDIIRKSQEQDFNEKSLRERIAILEREKYDLTLRVIDARERVEKQRRDIAGLERRIDVVRFALNRL